MEEWIPRTLKKGRDVLSLDVKITKFQNFLFQTSWDSFMLDLQ